MEIRGKLEGVSSIAFISGTNTSLGTEVGILKSQTLKNRVTSKMAPEEKSESEEAPQDLLTPWRKALGLVLVPSGAGEMIFMLSVQGQSAEDDRAWFDDCQVVKYND